MFLGPLLLGHTFAWSRSTVFFHTLPRQITSGLGTGFYSGPGVRVPDSGPKGGHCPVTLRRLVSNPASAISPPSRPTSILEGYAFRFVGKIRYWVFPGFASKRICFFRSKALRRSAMVGSGRKRLGMTCNVQAVPMAPVLLINKKPRTLCRIRGTRQRVQCCPRDGHQPEKTGNQIVIFLLH